MTPIVAITGGIGAGKTHVCRLLSTYGIEVYDCDATAKRLMREDVSIRHALLSLVGSEAYVGKTLQKAVIAKFLLSSEANKQAVNSIVHPAVARDFLSSRLRFIECAILFESHFDELIHPDYVVCVTAPLQVRIKRIMQRDGISSLRAEEWTDRQMEQDEMVARSNYVINNDGVADVRAQVEDLLRITNSL